MAKTKSSDDARLAQLRELLGQAVVIPTERLQAVLDDARKRGHIDTKGVEEIVQGLVKQTEDVRAQLEQLLGAAVGRAQEAGRAATEPLLRAVGRGGGEEDDTPSTVQGGGAGRSSRKAVAKSSRSPSSGTKASGPKASKPKASKAGSSGAGFPIKDYDDLKAADITAKLDGLTAAQLKKVRKKEEDGKARKGVLQAIDRKLS